MFSRVSNVVLLIVALIECFLHSLSQKQQQHSRQLSFEWANVYPGLTSKTVPLDCQFQDQNTCCSALQDPTEQDSQGGIPLDVLSDLQREGSCITKKQYYPSPYETRHLLKAQEIAQIKDRAERHSVLLDFIASPEEVKAAQKWLARVKVHMSSENTVAHGTSNSKGNNNGWHKQRLHGEPLKRLRDANTHGKKGGRGGRHSQHGGGRRASVHGEEPAVHPDDEEYLSKFVLTRTCEGEQTAPQQWVEWIEPLSVHARHPFGMSHCTYNNRVYGEEIAKSGVPNIQQESIFSVDYVLLQSAASLPAFEVTSSPAPSVRKTKSVLFDAGTSRFDSSLFWFTCGFSQRKIDFDSIFGWEMSLLNPEQFWRHVPPRWKPRYHFFNKGITASPTDADSVQTLTKQLGLTQNDFVAFKLDIDTPTIEIPIALDLLNGNSHFAELVDEFFFELHFRCEIMMPCGWDSGMPDKVEGLRLDRPGALELFRDLRRRGIRAHFWP